MKAYEYKHPLSILREALEKEHKDFSKVAGDSGKDEWKKYYRERMESLELAMRVLEDDWMSNPQDNPPRHHCENTTMGWSSCKRECTYCKGLRVGHQNATWPFQKGENSNKTDLQS